MEASKLKEILDKHLHWICEDVKGWEDMRANLSEANLSGANLSGANLSRANLSMADLYEANLSRANLSMADLSMANLYEANLSRANLSMANLSMADLYEANLSEANLSGANLSGANLSGANLSGANLSGANLYGADLRGANIENDLLNKYCPIVCPDSGAFVGWKKCRDGAVVKLEVLADAKRSSAFGRKCRCSAAKVLEITDANGNQVSEAVSWFNSSFVYRVGEIVSVDDFDEDRKNECGAGIHFFITRQEAVDYEC